MPWHDTFRAKHVDQEKDLQAMLNNGIRPTDWGQEEIAMYALNCNNTNRRSPLIILYMRHVSKFSPAIIVDPKSYYRSVNDMLHPDVIWKMMNAEKKSNPPHPAYHNDIMLEDSRVFSQNQRELRLSDDDFHQLVKGGELQLISKAKQIPVRNPEAAKRWKLQVQRNQAFCRLFASSQPGYGNFVCCR